MFKNVASQKITFLVIDTAANVPKTGDSANLTAYVSKDDGAVTVLGDTSATELDATNAPGLYSFDLTQAETNADKLLFSGKSSTSGIRVVPLLLYTAPSGFGDLTIANNATAANITRISGSAVSTSTAQLGVNAVNIGGTAQTGRDIGASVLLSSGTGTGQVTLTSGRVNADITHIATAAVSTSTAQLGVNVVQAGATAWGSGAITAGSIASDAITAAKIADGAIDAATFATGAITATAIAADAIGASELAADAVAEIQSGLSTLTAADVRTAVGLASANLDTQLSAISGYVDDIGAAGAGLTAIPWNAAWDAEVQSECNDAIVANNLDHLILTAVTSGVVADNSIIAKIVSKNATSSWDSDFDPATDALNAISDAVDLISDDMGTNGDGLTALASAADLATLSAYVDTEVAAIKAKTDNLPAAPASTGDVTGVWTTAMTESYAADGATMTPAQALYMLLSAVTEFSISGTTITCKKLDGTTTSMAYTLDSASLPTSRTRAS